MPNTCKISNDITSDTPPLSDKTRQALASLRLEGIIPSPELLADIKLFDAGKITSDELLARGLKRARS